MFLSDAVSYRLLLLEFVFVLCVPLAVLASEASALMMLVVDVWKTI